MEAKTPTLKAVETDTSVPAGVRITADPIRLEHPTHRGVALLLRPVDELEHLQFMDSLNIEGGQQTIGAMRDRLIAGVKFYVRGWEGILDAKGDPLPFETEEDGTPTRKVAELLLRPELAFPDKGKARVTRNVDGKQVEEEQEVTIRTSFPTIIFGRVKRHFEETVEGKG